jgi:hypothetical protein
VKLKKAKKAFRVTWSTVSKAQKISRYQVAYRVKGTSKWKVKSFKAKAASAVIEKLKAKKRYQVRVRSYKTVERLNYYSDWSATKTVRMG